MVSRDIFLVHYGGEKAPYLTIGTLYVANSLQNAGYNPILIPSNIPESKFELMLSEHNPLYVGFSVFTFPQISDMIRLSKTTQKMGFKTVWGGYHPTVLPEQCIEEPFVDYVVCGEGEEISVEFSRQLSNGNLEKKIIFKSPRIINDLDNFQPALNLVNLNDYVSIIPKHLREKYGLLTTLGYMLTSRGCLSRCKFCGVHGIYSENKGSIWNSHSFNWVSNQVDYIKSRLPHLDNLIIWDDSFFKGKNIDERAKKIMDELEKKELHFTLEARGTFLKKRDNVKILKDKGCLQVFVGAESGSQRVLNLMRKDAEIEDYLIAVQNCSEADLPIRMSFFYGYPGETLDDINKTKKFLKFLKDCSGGITVSGPKMYRPVPGTEGFEEALKLGFIRPKNTQDWANVNSNTNPSMLPWLVEEARKARIQESDIYDWLGIRKNK